MADSNVTVTAGVGTSIDTRTEATNGHHRQVVVLGDPSTNAGVAPVDATAGLKVDLGADNDITGTVTANLSATDNAVLDAIEADTTSILADTTTIAGDTTSIDAKIPALGQALAAGSVPVVLTAAQITTLTPPAAITGFATSAKQDTIIGHVDGIETLLGTIDSDTGTIATEVAGLLTDTELRATPVPVSGTVAVTNAGLTALNGAISGTEVQVDVLTMPTVTVTATNLDVQSGGADLATSAQGAAIQTAVEIIDNAISGSEMQVDVVGALPAGTNTIGAVKSVPSDIDINGSNANHADKYYTNAGAVTDGIIWSPAAGKRWHVLNLTINVSAACTVTIEDDLAAGDNPRLKFEFAANSGITIPYNKEHPFSSGEDAADLLITTTAGNVYVQAVGYEV